MNEVESLPIDEKPIPRPVPLWIKLGAIVLLIAAGLFIALLFSPKFDDADQLLLAPAKEAPVEEKPTAEPQAEAVQPEQSPAEEIPGGVTQYPSVDSPEATRTDLKNSVEKITGLIEVVSSHAESLATLRQTLESQRGEIETLRQWIGELERANLEQGNAAKIAATAPAKPQKPAPIKRVPRKEPSRIKQPLFELVGIDRWNGEANAMIRANGRLDTLKQGARIEDWTVDGIDTTTAEVTLRNDSGQTARIAPPVKSAEPSKSDVR